MSSSYVRGQVFDFLEANAPDETVIDLSVQFGEFKEFLTDNGVEPDAPWLGVEFIGGEDIPVSLAATNDQGLYRETGAIQFHVCTIAKLGCGPALLARGEALRRIFKGQRIGSMHIQDMTLFNTTDGAALQFEGGYVSGSFLVSYIRDENL